jgi:peptidyl-prolyl cis-trans isomerase SurA
MRVVGYCVFAAILIVACGVHGREELSDGILLDGVAAHVNSDVVTIGDVLISLGPTQNRLGSMYRGGELKKKLADAYAEILTSLIDRHLILQSYEKKGLQIPEWIVDRRVREVVRDQFQDDYAGLMGALAEEKITLDEWRQKIRDQIILSSMRGAQVNQHITISPKAMREFYDNNRAKFVEPAEIKLRMIVLDAKTGRDRANEILKGLKKGDEFAVFAKEHSVGSHAAKGGDWGWVKPGILRRELAEVANKLAVGNLSGAVEVADSLYIIKVDDKRGGGKETFEDAQKTIEMELRREEAEKLYEAWLARLRKVAYIKIFDVDLF